MAERVRVSNRAQALSFSLAHVALVRGAAQLATGVAGRVSQAIGFDDILHGTDAETAGGQATPVVASASELKGQLTDGIRLELAKRSINLNQPLELRVHQDGSLRVEGDHPRAAEIEALLNSDGDAVRLAGELAKATGSNQISIDLTSSGGPGNIIGLGGYPNW